jgi:hypothetical protein
MAEEKKRIEKGQVIGLGEELEILAKAKVSVSIQGNKIYVVSTDEKSDGKHFEHIEMKIGKDGDEITVTQIMQEEDSGLMVQMSSGRGEVFAKQKPTIWIV